MNTETLIKPLKIIVLLAITTFLVSCGDDSTTNTTTGTTNIATDTLSSLFEREFKSCALNCHSPGGTEAAGPDMSNKNSFHAALVNKSAVNYPLWFKGSTCSLVVGFITPNKAAESMLLATFVQAQSELLSAATSCITSYNLHVANRVSLSAAGIVDLTSWINKGALNN